MTTDAVGRSDEPDFIQSLQGFAAFCESGGPAWDQVLDLKMLAGKFRDAAFVCSMFEKQRDELRARITSDAATISDLSKHVYYLRDALDDTPKSVWRDIKLSTSAEEAIACVDGWVSDAFAEIKAKDATIAAKDAEIERLRAALEPFAEAASFYDPPEGDDNQMAWSHDFPIGSLRRARAAFNTGESDAG